MESGGARSAKDGGRRSITGGRPGGFRPARVLVFLADAHGVHMSTIAIQLSADGIHHARMPDPLHLDADNPVTAEFIPWPVIRHPHRDRLPIPMEERVLAYAVVRDLLADADDVVLAVESGVDRVRVGIAEVAFDHADVHVEEVQPHPDGAAGLMTDEIEAVLARSPRPPGV